MRKLLAKSNGFNTCFCYFNTLLLHFYLILVPFSPYFSEYIFIFSFIIV